MRKKLRARILKWLLKDTQLGFSVSHCSMTRCKDISISSQIITHGNVVINGVDLPEYMEVVIRRKDYRDTTLIN